MADIADVERAVVGLIARAIYPNGTAQPCAIADGDGTPIPARVYRGDPPPLGLLADLRAGFVNISVLPAGSGHNVTRYLAKWRSLPPVAATLAVAQSGDTVTLSGTPGPGQNVAAIVNGTGFVHAVQEGDTLAAIAAALAQLIGGGASSDGPVLTVPAAGSLSARVGTTATALRELARFQRDVQVTLWCSTPAIRDAVAAVAVPALAQVIRLTLADGSSARMILDNDGDIDDGQQKEQAYRRTLHLQIEYATTEVEAAPTVTVFDASVARFSPTLSGSSS